MKLLRCNTLQYVAIHAIHCNLIKLLRETSECYIKIIQDMYDGATKTVRSAAELT